MPSGLMDMWQIFPFALAKQYPDALLLSLAGLWSLA
jgi:hypothetical protein